MNTVQYWCVHLNDLVWILPQNDCSSRNITAINTHHNRINAMLDLKLRMAKFMFKPLRSTHTGRWQVPKRNQFVMLRCSREAPVMGAIFKTVMSSRYSVSTVNNPLSSVPWSIRPLMTHDVFIFKVRFLAASHMVRGDVSPVFSITWLRKRSLCPPLAFFPWTLPARMRSSSSPFRMMWPVKRVCLSLMVLRSWRSCPIRWSTEMLVSCAVYETRSIRR